MTLQIAPGQTVTAKEVYEALDTKFGTVASLTPVTAYNNLIFEISS